MNNLAIFKHEMTGILYRAWSGNVSLWKLLSISWCLGLAVVLLGFYSIAWLMSFNAVVIAQQLYGLILAFIICHSICMLVSGWRTANKVKSSVAALAVKAGLIFYILLMLRIINFIPVPGLQFGI